MAKLAAPCGALPSPRELMSTHDRRCGRAIACAAALALCTTFSLNVASALPLGPNFASLSIQLAAATYSLCDGARATLAPAEPSPASLHPQQVHWTVGEAATIEQIASLWGLRSGDLIALNPTFSYGDHVPAHTRLLVYAFDPDKPSRSIGRPQSGRLLNAVPFPEGEGWRLRDNRRLYWATAHTIHALTTAFTHFNQHCPGSQDIRVGNLSKRNGGRAKPHRSHTSGRDIDLGYFAPDESIMHYDWVKVSTKHFDAERTWCLMHAMLDTGHVEAIYTDRRLLPAIKKAAAAHLSPEELDQIFPQRNKSHALIRHWPGHSQHMHVRFTCPPGDHRCRR